MTEKKSLGPDFIGIGTMKSASGWIFKCLREHPEVSNKNIKELYFFNNPFNYKKGINTYYSIFRKSPKNSIKGEYTPSYMLNPEVAFLIHKHFPDVKIIACLRNPAERAYSDYRYNIQENGRFTRYNGFEDTINKDQKFVERGFYYKQLKSYFELFPRENILILFYEDLVKDPIKFIEDVHRFLGLKNVNYKPSLLNRKLSITGSYIIKYKLPILNSLIYWLDSKIKNTSKLRKLIDKSGLENYLLRLRQFNRMKIIGKNENVFSIPPLRASTRSYLLNHIYKEDINKLEKLLNKDLSFWK
ncbi:MAG: sulfotransferase [Promethearchaeota archaeon]